MSKIPKIEFRYSRVYDDRHRNSPFIKKILAKCGKKYPSEKEIIDFRDKLIIAWSNIGNKLMKEMSNISGLKWHDDKIICYIVGSVRPFSDPLTIGITTNKSTNYFIDELTHELIHRLFTQKGNLDKSSRSWDYLYKKYVKETTVTHYHIPLHAIHAKILINLYKAKDVEKRLHLPNWGEYKRSWEIVKKEGYDNIIKEFRKRLK